MPDLSTLTVLAVLVIVIAATVGATGLLYRRLVVIVSPDQALVVTKPHGRDVFFANALVLPIAQHGELVDLRAVQLSVQRVGKDGLSCQDNIRADVEAVFTVSIVRTRDSVLKVAGAVGAARAAEPELLRGLLGAKFSQALSAAAVRRDFDALVGDPQAFVDEILEELARDLNGYCVGDLALRRLEQTPIHQLDPYNLRDAKGIRKITEQTTQQKRRAAEAEIESQRHVATLRSEARTILLEQERIEADAFAALRRDTGREVTREQLDERLAEKLREIIDANAEPSA